MNTVAGIFRYIASYMMVMSYTLDELSDIFYILARFIKSAPRDFFEEPAPESKKSFKEIPLYLTDKGRDALREELAKYPKIQGTGRLQQEPGFKQSKPNFIYLLGQFLTVAATKIDYIEMQNKPAYMEHKNDIQKLFKIWDSEQNMNALHLFQKYESKNNETAKKDLTEKLSESAAIVDSLHDIKI